MEKQNIDSSKEIQEEIESLQHQSEGSIEESDV